MRKGWQAGRCSSVGWQWVWRCLGYVASEVHDALSVHAWILGFFSNPSFFVCVH